MFDIKEYYHNSYNWNTGPEQELLDIENDINYDIDELLNKRFDKLYQVDRFKTKGASIDIIHPALNYPGNTSFLNSPDKIRFLLSFYPYKEDFAKISKIVLRPRYIEMANIELSALYLRNKKILILYLSYPHFYNLKNPTLDNDQNQFISIDIEQLMNNKLSAKNIDRRNNPEIKAHPLWYMLSTIPNKSDNQIDKFFIKKKLDNDKTYRTLVDISHFYSQRGY